MPKLLQHWHIYIHYTTDTVSWFILVVKSQHLSPIIRIKITVVKQMYVPSGTYNTTWRAPRMIRFF